MLAIAFIFYGFTATIGQLLLLRELHVVFPVNEYTISFGLATWLFGVGIGSGWRKGLPFSIMNVLTALSIPLSIIIARSLKHVFGIGFGELAGPVAAFWGILLTMLPVAFAAGSQFASATSLVPGRKVYFWESIGAVAGGLAFTFFLVEVAPIKVALSMLLFNISLSLLFVATSLATLTSSCALIILGCLVATSTLPANLDFNLRKWEWRSYRLLSETNTRFGHLAVTGTGALYSLFEDGIIAATWPLPEYTEELVHMSLLACPKVEHVLLIGGSYKGTVAEILKHNPTSIDVVEPNKRLKPFLEPYLDSGTLASFKDSIVHYHYTDGRLWLASIKNAYDAVILDLPPPVTSVANRFYTQEFFALSKTALKPGGILAFKLPGTENYINPELQMFNAVIYQSLRHSFPHAVALPGLNTLFLCPNTETPLLLEPVRLARVYESRKLKNRLVVPVYFPFKLNKERMEYLKIQLGKQVALLNSDFKPVSYTLWHKFWKKEFYSSFYVVNYILAVSVLFMMVRRAIKSISVNNIGWTKTNILLIMGVLGLAGILFEFAVILIYQTRFGYVYEQLGLIFASFMLGLAVGSGIPNFQYVKDLDSRLKHTGMTTLLLISTIGLSAICGLGSVLCANSPRLWLFAGLVLAGIALGLAYAAACIIGESCQVPASMVYQADLIGSGTGAIFSLITIPQLGIPGTIKFLSVLCLCVSVPLCLSFTKRFNRENV